ncbi:hypothetical protein Droror1_Dr00021041 [Drosera rotundifolia]
MLVASGIMRQPTAAGWGSRWWRRDEEGGCNLADRKRSISPEHRRRLPNAIATNIAALSTPVPPFHRHSHSLATANRNTSATFPLPTSRTTHTPPHLRPPSHRRFPPPITAPPSHRHSPALPPHFPLLYLSPPPRRPTITTRECSCGCGGGVGEESAED